MTTFRIVVRAALATGLLLSVRVAPAAAAQLDPALTPYRELARSPAAGRLLAVARSAR